MNVLLTINRLFGLVGPDGKPRQKVLFIGDSLTAQPAGYQVLLAKELPQIDATVISRAGATTDWMLKEFVKHFSTKPKYDYIFILGGINDIYSKGPTGLVAAKRNLQAMYDYSKNTGAKLVVIDGINDLLRNPRNVINEGLYAVLKSWIMSNPAPNYKFSMAKYMNTSKKDCADGMCHPNIIVHENLTQDIKKRIWNQ